MISPGELFEYLQRRGFSFVTGVPDSVLSSFSSYVVEHLSRDQHVIAANEGAAVALAAGHYLATGESAIVYMQNSGLGNAVNPLLSLADSDVFGIPMLLMIGWRGEPGTHDEPQHLKQGRVTLPMLDTMGIPYAVLGPNVEWKPLLEDLICTMKSKQQPVAIVVRKGTFPRYAPPECDTRPALVSREDAIRLIVEQLGPTDVVVSSTGMISRELYEIRDARGEDHERDFLVVGSMGHCSQIALAIACRRPDRKVFCLDGDGAVIMHMGSLAIVGQTSPTNLFHIVLDNSAHDSVGGQPTASSNIDFVSLAKSLGYRQAFRAETPEEISQVVQDARLQVGPVLVWIRVKKGARANLGRPQISPRENKKAIMGQLVR